MKKRDMTGVLALLVFAVFMVSVLLVLLSGADTLQRISSRDRRSYHHRTAVQYISTRIRQADCAFAVSSKAEELNMLVLTERMEGRDFETRIYCCEGYLREMFCEKGSSLPPEFGEEILPMDGFCAACDGGSVRVKLDFPDGSSEELFLMLRSGGGLSDEK